MSTFGQVVRTAYKSVTSRSRYLAAIFTLVIIVASVVDNRGTQIAASFALLIVVLETLFRVEQRVTDDQSRLWFADFTQSLDFASTEIRRRLRLRRKVRVRWIGVTHEAGWPFCQNLLEKLIRDEFGGRAKIHIELMLLDPDGVVCSGPLGAHVPTIRNSISRVRDYNIANGGQLHSRRSSLIVYTYDFRPTWHAMLIDNDLLLYSTCRYGNLPLAAPQGGAEVVRRTDGGSEAERIAHFIDWSDAIRASFRAGASLS